MSRAWNNEIDKYHLWQIICESQSSCNFLKLCKISEKDIKSALTNKKVISSTMCHKYVVEMTIVSKLKCWFKNYNFLVIHFYYHTLGHFWTKMLIWRSIHKQLRKINYRSISSLLKAHLIIMNPSTGSTLTELQLKLCNANILKSCRLCSLVIVDSVS